jgi:hypothetical protein
MSIYGLDIVMAMLGILYKRKLGPMCLWLIASRLQFTILIS